MRRSRAAAVALVLGALISSCSSRTAVPDNGGTVPAAGGPRSSGTTSPHSGNGAGGSSGGSSNGGGSSSGGGGSGGTSFNDGSAVGDMARAFLRGSPARSLVIEVDWVTGEDPNQTSLDNLKSTLSALVDKPGGVSIRLGNQISSSRTSYSIGDIQAIEQANRNLHSSGDRATIWMVYLNGTFAQGAGALGVSYEASGTAIFRDGIGGATTALIHETQIEQAVITHEVGHLLAMVNLGYKSKYDHEDAGHPHHSNNQNSVMYWQVEDANSIKALVNGPATDFDSYDKADMAMLKSGG